MNKKPKLAAELVTLGGKVNRTYTHAQVREALAAAGLDPKAAREFRPRNAWSRVCRKLAEERVIDVIREDEDDALFQFSKRFLERDEADGGQEVRYKKETKIRLDKDTGELFCKDETIKQLARRELDRYTVERNNGDVTNVAQRLFRRNADLMPLPASVGVYLVPIQHQEFCKKVLDFLRALGRRPSVIPVLAEDEGSSQTVQDAMVEYLDGLVEDHLAAVAAYTESTKGAALEARRDRIDQTRVKVQAYALQLGELKDALLEKADEAQEELRKKIAELTGRNGVAEDPEPVEEPAPEEAPAAEEPEEPVQEEEPEAVEEEEVEEYQEVDF